MCLSVFVSRLRFSNDVSMTSDSLRCFVELKYISDWIEKKKTIRHN